MKVNTDGVLLGAWSSVAHKYRALDIGTGTGIIALILSQRNHELKTDAVEIDKDTFEQAAVNASSSRFADRIQVFHQSIQAFAKSSVQLYDLIISNPPYFNSGTPSANLQKANVRHTMHLSHSELLESVTTLLSPQGHFEVILPHYEGIQFIQSASKYRLYPVHITEVYPKSEKRIERLLIRMGKTPVSVEKSQLVIHLSDNPKDYSKEFIELTKELYLFMK